PDGRFCICVTHPINDAGGFEGKDPEAQFTICGTYLGRRPYEGTFERDGLRMTFRGWSQALEEYGRALEAAGFLIERIREPAASPEAVAHRAEYRRWQRVPMFLHMRARKAAPES
ncbi:MAG: class I SAM-dependent methyltransferase, partial [Chloroflexota bacterium]